MKRKIFSFLLIFSLTLTAQLRFFSVSINATENKTYFSYDVYDQVTRTYVNEQGQVDYKKLKANLSTLRSFIDLLAKTSPETNPELFASQEEKKRYYLTAYNALVMFFAAEAYPNKHILWSKLGYFKNKDIVLGGQKISLNYLEHEIIRKQFLDPRIHFYINCGANSCPPIRKGVIAQNKTEDELEDAARKFINNPNNVRFDAANRTLYLSKIFDWFESDFTSYLKVKRGLENPHISQYVALYLNEADSKALSAIPLTQLKIKHLDYDKELNEQ